MRDRSFSSGTKGRTTNVLANSAPSAADSISPTPAPRRTTSINAGDAETSIVVRSRMPVCCSASSSRRVKAECRP